MYHKTIESGQPESLTVTAQQLEEHFRFFQQEGYNCVSLREVVDHVVHGTTLRDNPLLITCDDGYKNNKTVLYPLLRKYNMKAVIFLVPGYIEKAEANDEQYMTVDDLLSMNSDVIEYGLHTFHHRSYNDLSLPEIENDIQQSKQWLEKRGVPFIPAHCFTYGEFPKADKTKLAGLFAIFERNGIQAAFNIGNRINALPIKNKFVIQRIDVRGTEPMSAFIPKVRKGKELVGFIKDLLGRP
jgi:peptidoglycan/xylan/chitin deacetylase (PgdA/CDA1 family)